MTRYPVCVAFAGILLLAGCTREAREQTSAEQGTTVQTSAAAVSETEAHHRELVAAGRASFRAYCAGCHGLEAVGDGPAAEWMKIPPADLTSITRRRGGTFPDAWVRSRIEGTNQPVSTEPLNQMPHFGEMWRSQSLTLEQQAQVDQLIDELVAYLAAIQASS